MVNLQKFHIQAQELAWRELLRQGVSALPVQVRAICRNLGIEICGFEAASPIMGRLIRKGRGQSEIKSYLMYTEGDPPVATIFLDERRSPQEIRFSIAREIGYFLLTMHKPQNLMPRDGIIYTKARAEDATKDIQATWFAHQLLGPTCILRALGVKSIKDIQYFCDVSETIAGKSMGQLEQLFKDPSSYSSKLEQWLGKNFKGFINEYRLR